MFDCRQPFVLTYRLRVLDIEKWYSHCELLNAEWKETVQPSDVLRSGMRDGPPI